MYHVTYSYPGVERLLDDWLTDSNHRLRMSHGFRRKGDTLTMKLYSSASPIAMRVPAQGPASCCFMDIPGLFAHGAKASAARARFLQDYATRKAETLGVEFYVIPFSLLDNIDLTKSFVLDYDKEYKDLLLSYEGHSYLFTYEPMSPRKYQPHRLVVDNAIACLDEL